MKNIVVFGASRDIGYNIAKALVKEGNNVISISRHFCDIPSVDNYLCDIIQYNELCDIVNKVCEKYKQIDGIVYSIGLSQSGSLSEMSIETFETIQKVNAFGYFYAVKAFYNQLVTQALDNKSCSIVQINSKTGKKGSYKNSAYAASKFAGLGLTQSFALELVEHNVRVNSVCPGNVFETSAWQDKLFKQFAHNQGLTEEQVRQKYINLVPMKQSCHYEDINNMVLYLLSDKSKYMTGQSINITGGQQLF